uniref:Gem-associated protein 8 n=1 Tax=Globodera rostochiensis TaxID=31243 RepID=A0A914HMF1_GLORO
MSAIKKSKYSESGGWADDDFVSFWKHYAKVQQWVQIERECRQNAMNDWEWRRAEIQCVSLLASTAAVAASDGPEPEQISSKPAENANTVEPSNRMPSDVVVEAIKTRQDTAVKEEEALNEPIYSSLPSKRKKGRKQHQKQRAYNQNNSNNNSLEYDEQHAGGDELDNESLDEDMKAFIQTTLEHRIQREQKKREEQQKKKQTRRQSGGEEYCDATNLNIKATRQSAQSQSAAGDGTAHRSSASELLSIRAREFWRANLYGTDGVAKLDSLEAKGRAHFEAEFAKNVPNTWPNIPLRF